MIPAHEQYVTEWYSQTCIRRPLLGPLNNGHLGQVVVLKNTFIKRPLIFAGIKICYCAFWCHSWRLKMLWPTFCLEGTYTKKWVW